MALQTLDVFEPIAGTGPTALLMDAAGEKVAGFFIAPRTGNVRKAIFRLTTVTTGQTLLGSLQLDDGAGLPDGTPIQSGTVAVADADDNSWKTVQFAADVAVTRGDRLHFVVEWDSTAGNLNVGCNNVNDIVNVYPLLFTASWAKQAGRAPMLLLEYDDGGYAHQPGCTGLTSMVDFASNSNPSERGNRFSYPYPMKVAGIRYAGQVLGDVELVLYDSDGTTALGTAALDKDQTSTNAVTPDVRARFASDVTLAANTVYYAVMKPTTTTSNRLFYQDFPTAAAVGILAEGANCYGVNRQTAGSGAFTTEDTRRYQIGVIPSAFDDGAGGGGGLLVPQGMTGGFHG